MKPIRDMDTVQIEVTNHCLKRCSNCTRLVGHHQHPYFMDMEIFKRAVDSLADFPNMVGVMGGEPLLHPEFETLSLYLHSKVAPTHTGLWTSLPPGKERYADLICQVYGNIFLNDHTRSDVLHAPVLVASRELIADQRDLFCLVESCWVQQFWSASINPHGAFFCEIAAALSMLIDLDWTSGAWSVEPGWWKRAPVEYTEQMRSYCTLCGCAMPIRWRASTEGPDDISPGMYKRLKRSSPKLRAGNYVIHDLKLKRETRQPATYKDEEYRNGIAARYGMFVVMNSKGFMTPHIKTIERRRKAHG